MLHIRSLISSNFNVYASHFEMINLIKGSIQTNDLIDVMNPLMMSFPIDIFVSSKSWFASSFL
jgi:hypothetical protein